jgi:Flp pilus assembly protein TadG
MSDRRAGVAAVELAVLLPLMSFLFVITVDFARIFNLSLTLTNCARNGAFYGSDPLAAAQSTFTSIGQAAQAEAPNLSPAPTVTSSTGTDGSGNPYVSVTVSGQFQTIFKYPGVPHTTTVSRTVQMRVAPITPS